MRSLPEPTAIPCFKRHILTAGASYDNLDEPCRRLQRAELVKNQDGLCVWCEQTITPENIESHTDHLKSQAVHPTESLSLTNIAASCKGLNSGREGQHCGHARPKRTDIPDCLNPYLTDNLQSKYKIQNDGELVLKEGEFSEDELELAEKAVNHHLKLNHRVLKNKRENRLRQLNFCSSQIDVDMALEVFPGFVSLTHQCY